MRDNVPIVVIPGRKKLEIPFLAFTRPAQLDHPLVPQWQSIEISDAVRCAPSSKHHQMYR